jgi:hypothetical protein
LKIVLSKIKNFTILLKRDYKIVAQNYLYKNKMKKYKIWYLKWKIFRKQNLRKIKIINKIGKNKKNIFIKNISKRNMG